MATHPRPLGPELADDGYDAGTPSPFPSAGARGPTVDRQVGLTRPASAWMGDGSVECVAHPTGGGEDALALVSSRAIWLYDVKRGAADPV